MTDGRAIRKTTVRQLILLNRACDRTISVDDVRDLYDAPSGLFTQLHKEGLLRVVKLAPCLGGKKKYYRTTVAGRRVVIENEKLLEEMFFPENQPRHNVAQKRGNTNG